MSTLVIAAVLSAWLQLTGTGPVARAVVTGACPPLVLDGRLTLMRIRAASSPDFPDTVCEGRVPFGARSVRIADRTLPSPTRGPLETVAVIGDTGCRIKGTTVQSCNDPAAWPFPRIAAAVAAAKPDLIVHVGDYLYRETPCTTATPGPGCTGSPFGDRAGAWNADWFAPAAPLFTRAPLVLVRGNHESCTRSGAGWSRYLAAQTEATCVRTENPYALLLDRARFVVMDDADDDDRVASAGASERSAQNLAAAARLAGGETFLLTHRPPYTTATLAASGSEAYRPYAAILSGHVHTFAALSTPNGPPQFINGMSGDLLDPKIDLAAIATGLYHQPFTAVAQEPSFGYALYRRGTRGWSVEIHAPDGRLRRTCTLEAVSVACAQTAADPR